MIFCTPRRTPSWSFSRETLGSPCGPSPCRGTRHLPTSAGISRRLKERVLNWFRISFKQVETGFKLVCNWFATGFKVPSFKLMYLVKELSVDYKKFKKKHSILLSHTRWGVPVPCTCPPASYRLTAHCKNRFFLRKDD